MAKVINCHDFEIFDKNIESRNDKSDSCESILSESFSTKMVLDK